ncbi:phage tail sheath family protein [Microbacterium sp. A93]|uniref:phage tail sheath family protein n=1 Tax=Microbacterium sp. A93 TaxID=3450716 RepID=UPI003F4447F0
MSITPTYPGVYVSEVPSGNRTVTGVATSVTAFIGRALRGPVDEPVRITNLTDFIRTFGPIWRLSGLGYAVRDFYLNGGGPAYVVRVARTTDTAEVSADDLILQANGPGSWGNRLAVVISYPDPADKDLQEIAESQGLTPDQLFTLELLLLAQEGVAADVENPEVEARETYVNVSVADGPRRVDTVLASSRLARVKAPLPATRPDPPTATDLRYIVTTTVDDGVAPEQEEYVPSGPARTGLRALDTVDLVNLLVLPPVVPGGDLPVGVWAPAMAYAVERRAFLIVDAPKDTALNAVSQWATTTAGLSGVNGRNAAVYVPRIRQADPLRDGAVGDFVPSGAIAGMYARTDATRGVWKAPAGTETGLTGVLGTSRVMTNAESAVLNPEGINALQTFPGAGTVLWGTRTLRGADRLADEYKYIPVRRLALFLEESLFRATQWVVFEPNDESLWSQIRLSVGSFMQDLFRKGAFQGASPKDAYFVRCSAETTTQYDIDRGIVNIEVGFAPLKPAEFVLITIQQKSAAAA